MIINPDGSLDPYSFLPIGIIFLVILTYMILRSIFTPEETECIFCKRIFYKNELEWHQHKAKCIQRNSFRYAMLPKPYRIHCHKCFNALRVWNRYGDRVDNLVCHNHENFKSNGSNLLICYPCDTFHCVECLEQPRSQITTKIDLECAEVDWSTISEVHAKEVEDENPKETT